MSEVDLDLHNNEIENVSATKNSNSDPFLIINNGDDSHDESNYGIEQMLFVDETLSSTTTKIEQTKEYSPMIIMTNNNDNLFVAEQIKSTKHHHHQLPKAVKVRHFNTYE